MKHQVEDFLRAVRREWEDFKDEWDFMDPSERIEIVSLWALASVFGFFLARFI